MTTIDRAGGCLAGEPTMEHHLFRFMGLLKEQEVTIHVEVTRRTSSVPYEDTSSFGGNFAKVLLAALRQPDQKGEATDALYGWRTCLGCNGSGKAFNAVECETGPCLYCEGKGQKPRTEPAPEAGKLPSEEEIIEAWERGFCNSCGRRNGPNDCTLSDDPEICGESYKRCNWRKPTPAESARAVLALLSPAQPHDVPAGDGLADLVARLRVEAASWRREDAHVARDEDSQAAFADEAADALEAQGHMIAELEEERDQFRADSYGEAEVNRSLVEALKHADGFITNGVELGYIRMPDADTPDPAHKTPVIVREALSLARASRSTSGRA